MWVVVEYPVTVHINNVEDIYLSMNTLVYQQKNHIDVRHCFIMTSIGQDNKHSIYPSIIKTGIPICKGLK